MLVISMTPKVRILPAWLAVIVMLVAFGLPASVAAQENAGGKPEASQQEIPPAANDKARSRLNWPSAWQPTVDGKDAKPVETPKTETVQAPVGTAPSQEPDAAATGTKPVAPPANDPSSTKSPSPTSSQPASPPPEPTEGTSADDADNGGVDEAKPNVPEPKNGVVSVPKDLVPDDLRIALGPVSALEQKLDAISKAVERVKDRDPALANQIQGIEQIVRDAEAAGNNLRPRLDDLKSQIEKLGPAPDGKDVPAESAKIAAERARLNALTAEVDGAIKKTDLLQVRGRQLVAQIQTLRQNLFTENLLQHHGTPLSLELWQNAGRELAGAGGQVNAIVSDWLSAAREKGLWLVALALAVIGLYGGLRIASNRFIASGLAVPAGEAGPGPSDKAYFASTYALASAMPSLVAAGILYWGLNRLGLLYLQAGEFIVTALTAFVVYKVSTALARAYLEPHRPDWQLVTLADGSPERLYRIIQGLAALACLDFLAVDVIRLLALPPAVFVTTALITTTGFAVLFYLFLRTRLSPPLGATAELPFVAAHLDWLKIPLALLLIAIVVSLLTGYAALAHYLAVQMVTTGAVLCLIAISFIAVRSLGIFAREAPVEASGFLRSGLGFGSEQGRRLAQIAVFFLYGALCVIAVPLLLLSFGLTRAEIGSLADKALFGFDIGGVRISLFRILIAVALFAFLLFLTRLVQRGLTESVLHPGRTDQGLANSIRTGIGYIGFGLAALVGLSYVGLDITNLAIVAGALSVGIGFGLQSIVNNFVSGLILLVERPIKVGDWIQVGTLEGHVRRISVRSTEVETFERASVIIPNSELITGTVTNLTHRNALGRVTVPVGVSYDCDPEHVQAILMKVAEECPLVAKHPAPYTVFENFGESSLDFSLRVFLTDINKGLSTRTQLRTEIWKAFRAEGIEIPYPQRDLRLRDLDGFRTAIARAVEERTKKGGL